MESAAGRDYAAFLEKVRRTVYIDNLSPQVTEAVIKTALDQFGSATNIQFIPSYVDPDNPACSALVELENEFQASSVLETLKNYPFMMSGMPRPVRASRAEIGMFDDRPVKPGRKLKLYWVDPNHPDYEVGQKLKDLTKKHHAEASFLMKLQLQEEAKLAKQQADSLKTTYQKFDLVDTILCDGTSTRLARLYNIKYHDDS